MAAHEFVVIRSYPLQWRRRRGFTLVELLVVIAIVGLLAALLMPAIQTSRESARRATCGNNLRQLGIGLQAYHNALGVFPAGVLDRKTSSKPKARQLAWSMLLLPYIEETSVYRLFDRSKAYNSAANRAAGGTVIAAYLCPSTVTLAVGRAGNTAGDVNANGLWDPGTTWPSPTTAATLVSAASADRS